MKFTIHKNSHRALPLYWLMWWPFILNPFRISRRIAFSFSCRYDLNNPDQQDHNKLFGASFSWDPKKNSARFGWRYDTDKKKFVISAFCHINGKMEMEDICDVVANRLYDCHLVISYHSYYFRVMQSDNRVQLGAVSVPKHNKTKFCYLLSLYFGGNQPAPHAMTVEMKKIHQ